MIPESKRLKRFANLSENTFNSTIKPFLDHV